MSPTIVVQGLLEHEDVDSLYIASKIAHGFPVVFLCNCVKVGQESSPYSLGRGVSLLNGRFMSLFCMAME